MVAELLVRAIAWACNAVPQCVFDFLVRPVWPDWYRAWKLRR